MSETVDYGLNFANKNQRSMTLWSLREPDGCVYRKPKSEHDGDEGRQRSGVNL